MVATKLAGVWALWYADSWMLTFAACVVYAWVVANNWREIR
jgi:hypothetical protein